MNTMEDSSELSVSREGLLAFVVGMALGVAAGLIGVGGGEFRIPSLLYLFRLDVKTAAGVNLIVGLFTVVLSFIRRWGQQSWSSEDFKLAGVLIIASILGSLVGAWNAHRLPHRPLKWIVVAYLLVVGIWMMFEAATHADYELMNPQGASRWILAAIVALLIAAVSASIGVAGGEMRIPALMYLFGYGVREAGTVSLLASIPTVGAGAVAYRRMGHIQNRAVVISLIMAVGSLCGVLVGTSMLTYVNKHVLKGVLGAILLLATICLVVPLALGARNGTHSTRHGPP